jgi:hypothetical protein
VTRLRRGLGDPLAVSVGVLILLAAGGLVGVAVGWKGAAASLIVAVQLPYIVSGVMGGLALLGFALGLLLVQARRHAEAQRRAEFDRVVEAAAGLLAVTRAARAGRR